MGLPTWLLMSSVRHIAADLYVKRTDLPGEKTKVLTALGVQASRFSCQARSRLTGQFLPKEGHLRGQADTLSPQGRRLQGYEARRPERVPCLFVGDTGSAEHEVRAELQAGTGEVSSCEQRAPICVVCAHGLCGEERVVLRAMCGQT